MQRSSKVPARTLLVGVVASLAAASGCLSGLEDGAPTPSGGKGPSSESSPCVEGGTSTGNAPPIAPFRGEPADVVARFADALGDPLVSREPDASRSSGDDAVWVTESGGEVRIEGEDADSPALRWIRGEPLDGDEAAAREFLDATLPRFGVPEDATLPPVNTNNAERPHLSFWQEFRGERVEATGGHLSFDAATMMTIRPYRDFSEVDVRVTEEEAEATARERVRCELDREGSTAEAGYRHERTIGMQWAVAHDSLVRTVVMEYSDPEPGHCSLVYFVDVDAESGAVVGWGRPPCD